MSLQYSAGSLESRVNGQSAFIDEHDPRARNQCLYAEHEVFAIRDEAIRPARLFAREGRGDRPWEKESCLENPRRRSQDVRQVSVVTVQLVVEHSISG